MKWISEESAMCYADEYITIKYADSKSSILFTGIIKGLKFFFNFSVDNVKENNSIECSFPSIAECKYYPFHILGSSSEECEGQYDNICEGKHTNIASDNYSQHTFRFEKQNGEVLFTAKLLKSISRSWFETNGGGRRQRPPYDLLPHEKTQGVGYAENIYLDPLKQLIAATIEDTNPIPLACDSGNWYYALEEYIAIGKLYYPDGRTVVIENTNYWKGRKLFRADTTIKDYVELAGKKVWYVAEYSQSSNDSKADATIIFQSDSLLKFEGSFIRHSVARVEKTPGRTRGYIAYYEVVGTISQMDGSILTPINLYNDETVVEDISLLSAKHETFTVIGNLNHTPTNPSTTTLPNQIGLDDLVGMAKVKQTFEEFRKFGEYKRLISLDPSQKEDDRDRLLDLFNQKPNSGSGNASSDTVSLHMVFLGSPGTGKTTVAERIASLLKQFGLVVTNEVPTIVVRSDLVGKYIGHTEEIVRKKIEEAMGGILFVDEAHTLFETNSGNDFGRIALNEIMYAMEQHRDQLVVILAGYTNEMLHMLNNANPGLTSRIPWYFYFEDYSPSELWEILNQKITKNGYSFDSSTLESIRQKALGYFSILKKELDGIKEDGRTKHLFGNGRGVRTFFQYMQIGLAVRLTSEQDNSKDLHIFTLHEIDYAYDTFKKSATKLTDKQDSKPTIGFKQG